MIPVTRQQEPEHFNEKVRIPGKRFLESNSHLSSKLLQQHNYWRHIKGDLYRLYQSICAYTGEWLPDTAATVDHFIPKSKAPQLAYEWDNYRLTTDKMNNLKADNIGLVDPFEVKIGWFVLVFPVCDIKPCMTLNEEDSKKVKNTIDILKLNSSEHNDKRYFIIQNYINNIITFDFLKEKYPYIAFEIERQGVRENIGDYFINYKEIPHRQ
jgi:hypothetical protein